ncbi:MAG: serine hydrolase [Leptolyngbyaceae bacterium]|nr:serine hydrolase [Leptolyngbyaceae bacterium]
MRSPKGRGVKQGYIVFLLATLLSVGTGFAGFQFLQAIQYKRGGECDRLTHLDLKPGVVLDQSVDIREGAYRCYDFNANVTQTLVITSTYPFTLIFPDGHEIEGDNIFSYYLETSGRYQIKVNGKSSISTTDSFRVRLLDTNDVGLGESPPSLDEANLSFESAEPEIGNSINNPLSSSVLPSFSPDWRLQKVVDDVVEIVKERGLPTQKLSVSLVNLTDGSCCAYAGFNDSDPRYPASVVKLFWLVILYNQYSDGTIAQNSISETEIHEMIADSDNEPASRVLDLITQTSSGVDLPPDELDQWINKRYSTNYFFENLGYYNLNISQKTFPIPYLQLNGPEGREKQMRGDENQPLRNFLTTYSTARLLYEIDIDQAIAPEYSEKIKSHLLRNLEVEAWQYVPFNSIDGFLGEGLPPDSIFYSKAGWTSANRNDSAIIESPDGSVKYILVVFGDDAAFKEDEDIFPMISREIYSRLSHME